MKALITNREAVLASVAGSTAATDFPSIVAFLAQHLDAAAGRGAAARDRSRERSDRLRGAVRKAAGALPMQYPSKELEQVIGSRLRSKPSLYGLKQSPSLLVLRDEISKMQCSGTETSNKHID